MFWVWWLFGNILLGQKYYFKPIKLLSNVLCIQINNWEQMMCFSNSLLVTKYQRAHFKSVFAVMCEHNVGSSL